MAQAGFSGESRFALPGAAPAASSDAVGLVLAGRESRGGGALSRAMALLMLAAVVARAASLVELRRPQAHQWAPRANLAAAVDEIGGAQRVLDCGVP